MIFIPKDDEEVPLIIRLGAIDSFDAEINLLRRILVSHRTMDQAEARNVITDHQYGAGKVGKGRISHCRANCIEHYTP